MRLNDLDQCLSAAVVEATAKTMDPVIERYTEFHNGNAPSMMQKKQLQGILRDNFTAAAMGFAFSELAPLDQGKDTEVEKSTIINCLEHFRAATLQIAEQMKSEPTNDPFLDTLYNDKEFAKQMINNFADSLLEQIKAAPGL